MIMNLQTILFVYIANLLWLQTASLEYDEPLRTDKDFGQSSEYNNASSWRCPQPIIVPRDACSISAVFKEKRNSI